MLGTYFVRGMPGSGYLRQMYLQMLDIPCGWCAYAGYIFCEGYTWPVWVVPAANVPTIVGQSTYSAQGIAQYVTFCYFFTKFYRSGHAEFFSFWNIMVC